VGDFSAGLFVGFLLLAMAVFCLDRGVNTEEFDTAVSKCPNNGGLKIYNFDVEDATVTCNNGAVFTYKLGGTKNDQEE